MPADLVVRRELLSASKMALVAESILWKGGKLCPHVVLAGKAGKCTAVRNLFPRNLFPFIKSGRKGWKAQFTLVILSELVSLYHPYIFYSCRKTVLSSLTHAPDNTAH